MHDPCTAKADIDAIRSRQEEQGKILFSMEKLIPQQYTEMKEFIKESREVNQLLRESAAEAREGQRSIARQIQVLFQKDSERQHQIIEVVEKKIEPLGARLNHVESWVEEQKGRMSFLKDVRVTIPVVCVLVSTCILIWDKLP